MIARLLLTLCLLLSTSPTWAATIFNDTCTDTDGDNIDTQHTPNTGTSWTEFSTVNGGQIAVYGNSCTEEIGPGSNIGAQYTADATYSTANYTVTATYDVFTSTAAGRISTLICRWQDANNFYAAWIEDSAGTNDVRIYDCTAGTCTKLSSTEDTNPTAGDVFILECNGSSIGLKKNGSYVISPITDATHSAAGKAGMGAGTFGNITAGSGNGNIKITTFLVETIDAVATRRPQAPLVLQ